MSDRFHDQNWWRTLAVREFWKIVYQLNGLFLGPLSFQTSELIYTTPFLLYHFYPAIFYRPRKWSQIFIDSLVYPEAMHICFARFFVTWQKKKEEKKGRERKKKQREKSNKILLFDNGPSALNDCITNAIFELQSTANEEKINEVSKIICARCISQVSYLIIIEPSPLSLQNLQLISIEYYPSFSNNTVNYGIINKIFKC